MQDSLPTIEKRVTKFGGDSRRGKRKTARPIAVKRPMHLVLKSEKAVGERSLLKRSNARFIRELLKQLSAAYAVNIREFTNVGNHLHLLVQARSRGGFQNFLRVLGSKIALELTGAKKGLSFGKFWTQSAFTRIVEGSADLWSVLIYIRSQGDCRFRLSLPPISGTYWPYEAAPRL
jgi:REP element-mobilizing transposase RayT